MTLDELLEAMPDVGLRLWMLDEIVGGQWHAAVYAATDPLRSRSEGEGGSPVEALVRALTAAGVQFDE